MDFRSLRSHLFFPVQPPTTKAPFPPSPLLLSDWHLGTGGWAQSIGTHGLGAFALKLQQQAKPCQGKHSLRVLAAHSQLTPKEEKLNCSIQLLKLLLFWGFFLSFNFEPASVVFYHSLVKERSGICRPLDWDSLVNSFCQDHALSCYLNFWAILDLDHLFFSQGNLKSYRNYGTKY